MAEPTVTPSQRAPGASPAFWAILFLVAAAVLVIVGFNEMYSYDPLADAGKIVGGDAYNYIIIATRGVGFICAGIVSALVGVSAVLIGGLTKLRS